VPDLSSPYVGGCRKKPFKKTRNTLAEVHVIAAMHDALATDRLLATHEMAVLGTHPYRRSSGLARGFPDSVPGAPPPPLRKENRRGYFQVSASDGLRRRRGAMRISLPPD